jgi:hypothetical protein
MPANPEPNKAFGAFLCDGAISQANTNAPENSNFLQFQRAMTRITPSVTRTSSPLVHGLPAAVLGSGTRTPASRNASKRCATTGFEVCVRLFCQMIELTCRNIFFKLPVPRFLVAVSNERDQLGELLGRKSIYGSFNFGQTHSSESNTWPRLQQLTNRRLPRHPKSAFSATRTSKNL